MGIWFGDGSYICQHPPFGKYQMPKKYLEKIRQYYLFHACIYEGARSSRVKTAGLWYCLVIF